MCIQPRDDRYAFLRVNQLDTALADEWQVPAAAAAVAAVAEGVGKGAMSG